MVATQLRFFPDTQPLVERLGRDFFRGLPRGPGVYVMHDSQAAVLYVGKAKNLHRRLGSYRVANVDRMPRRILRLLNRVSSITWLECADEASALLREAEMIRSLKPPFNRAGTWPAPPRYLNWRLTPEALELALTETPEPGWRTHGPLRGGSRHLHAAVARLLWCGMIPTSGIAGLPEGWFHGRMGKRARVPHRHLEDKAGDMALEWLETLVAGDAEGYVRWVLDQIPAEAHPLGRAALELDAETVTHFFGIREDALAPPKTALVNGEIEHAGGVVHVQVKAAAAGSPAGRNEWGPTRDPEREPCDS